MRSSHEMDFPDSRSVTTCLEFVETRWSACTGPFRSKPAVGRSAEWTSIRQAGAREGTPELAFLSGRGAEAAALEHRPHAHLPRTAHALRVPIFPRCADAHNLGATPVEYVVRPRRCR
jgi:hypothetical protein